MVFREFMKVTQLMTPGPSQMSCLCVHVRLSMNRSEHSREWELGKFRKGLRKEILLSRAFYFIQKNYLAVIYDSDPKVHQVYSICSLLRSISGAESL